MELDPKDLELLTLLQANGKQPTKFYALKLGLSTTAVYERIKRLERTGVITTYAALLDKKKVDRDFVVFCQVRLLQHVKENLMRFEREVVQLKEVAECYHVSGDYDYLLKIHLADMQAYRDFMVSKLTSLSNIANTQSVFVISEVHHSTALALH